MFLGDSCVKKIIYFCERLVHIKYKMKEVKTALLEILKQEDE